MEALIASIAPLVLEAVKRFMPDITKPAIVRAIEGALDAIKRNTADILGEVARGTGTIIQTVDYHVKRIIVDKYQAMANRAIELATIERNRLVNNALSLNPELDRNLKNWIIFALATNELIVDAFSQEEKIAVRLSKEIAKALTQFTIRGLFSTKTMWQVNEDQKERLIRNIDLAANQVKSQLEEEASIEKLCMQYRNISIETLLDQGAIYNQVGKIKVALKNPESRDLINANRGDGVKCKGYRPIHYAASYGHCEAIRTLVAGGADINILNTNYTPLHSAIYWLSNNPQKLYETVKTLLECGADPNRQETSSRYTPLHYLIYYCASYYPDDKKIHATVNTLLQHNADPTIKNCDGDSVIDFAKYYLGGSHKIVEDLQEASQPQDLQVRVRELEEENSSLRRERDNYKIKWEGLYKKHNPNRRLDSNNHSNFFPGADARNSDQRNGQVNNEEGASQQVPSGPGNS